MSGKTEKEVFTTVEVLVQARLCAGKTRQSRFIFRGGDVKQVQAGLSAMEDRESSFHHRRGPV